MARVDVIIPTYNRSERLLKALDSVFSQTFKDIRIIVVDDGSTDATSEVLYPFMNRITYLRHERNKGVSAARNSGIMAGSAPLLAFLDSDDYWLPAKLEEQVCFFSHRAEAGACQTEEIWIRNGRRVNPCKHHKKPSGNVFQESLKLCVVSPSAVMLRRSLLDEKGMFDEELPACEDYDLWLRISSNTPIYLIKKRLVVKQGGHSDQLSRLYEGMDRFRIKAIVKLLKSGVLESDLAETALRELDHKCRIYGQGCLKRGKIHEGERYLALCSRLREQLVSQRRLQRDKEL